LDAGSVTVKLVVMDDDCNIIHNVYKRHKGHPLTIAYQLLGEVIKTEINNDNCGSTASNANGGYFLSITGSAGKLLSDIIQVKHINEIVAQASATRHFFPIVKTVFEMGGEDSKLIILNDTGIEDFSMNSVCAAGTGSFIEQQAERLLLSLEEFSRLATISKSPPRIAGRCSVFAKSDMIHLQQIATPVEDIVAGLCFAVARNFKGTIVKGRKIIPKIAFQGGVAANAGIVRAFREIFDVDLIVPEQFMFMGAIGAILKDMHDNSKNNFYLENLEEHIRSIKISGNGRRSPLIVEGDNFLTRHGNGNQTVSKKATVYVNDCFQKSASVVKIKAYLGIDIGSISTNLAVINEKGELLSKRYLMTSGRPIDAVMRGLREVGEEIGENVEIAGVATTGSGRYMIADLVGADVVKNEITAQAKAAIFIDGKVDTIFEIGGQDSKYISIDCGVVVDFEMNKACAAGTGSFLEEQAEKLNISIKEEFANCAFSSNHPCNLGERCTVFMENSLMANLQQGTQKNDLMAGLAYSIVENYINRVVAGKKIGKNIFFQGGTAFNKSVVAAFEKFLGREITVPPNHDVTGAIGMALIAKEHMESSKDVAQYAPTKFKGFDLSKRNYEIKSFSCKGCSNVCEINRISLEKEEGHLFYGGRCEKYDMKKRIDKSEMEDLFAYREGLLWREYKMGPETSAPGARTIGVPYVFFFQDYLPFWITLLNELGLDAIVSPKTNRQIVNLGAETVLSETCFPVKVAHGHVKYLAENNVRNILLPSFVSLSDNNSYFDKESPCPYAQTIPYLAKAAFSDVNILSPIIDFRRGDDFIVHQIKKGLRQFGLSPGKIRQALKRAREMQSEFQRAIHEKGRSTLASLKERTVVIVGRTYNSSDSGVNLQLPQKLASLNVMSVPIDFLPLDSVDISNRWPQMYWKSGKRILQAARIIRDNPMLYPIYISNFNCGPDSFIFEYFKEEIGDKPFLFLEIDEHSADAGAITRCEAFLDSIEGRHSRKRSTFSSNISLNAAPGAISAKRSDELFLMTDDSSAYLPQDTGDKSALSRVTRYASSAAFREAKNIYIPRMSDHAFALAAAFEHSGIYAEVLPEPDRETAEIGRRHISGKQCYPCVLTIGEMLKQASSTGPSADKLGFFMPGGTGPCRFGQYNIFQRLVLDRLGLDNVRVYSPVQDRTFYSDLGIAGNDFVKRTWEGIVCIELLTKCLHETRPYEKEKGTSDYIYNKNLKRLYGALRTRNSDLEAILDDMLKEFSSVPRLSGKKPLIGIIGEIFVRSNKFTNDNLIGKIEALGGEVWLSPPEEWIYYVNHIGLKHAMIKNDLKSILKLFLKNRFQTKTEHRLGGIFKGHLKTNCEPSTRHILKKAGPYIHDSFEGETILSIGKAVDLIEKGVSGIVNAMPFGCMPGTIVTAIMRAVSRDYDIPCISIAYDGTESVTTGIQLEAFMHQTGEYMERT